MKQFNEVTRTTQRKWLKQLGEVALQRYGIKEAKLRFISESCFTVFRVDAQNQQYVLRISPEPPEDKWVIMNQAEFLWLAALRDDTSLPVPEPVPATDGAYVQTVSTKKIPDGRILTLLRWIPGRPIGACPKPSMASQMGAFMAQLHNHAEHFSFTGSIRRPHTEWDKLNYWHDPEVDASKTVTAEQHGLYKEASRRLLAEINQMGTTTNYGLIHADMTTNNCLSAQGQLRVIDFADCRFSSHFYDIAVPLEDLMECNNYEALKSAFYDGYCQIRTLDSCYEAAVETFIVARAFDVVEWIHLDWPTPTYHPYGPALLSKAYQQIKEYMQ